VQTAKEVSVPMSSARTILKHYHETGKLEPKQRGGNRRPVLTEEHLDWLQEQLDLKADLRVSDLVADTPEWRRFGYLQ
jgi:transposase